MSKEQHQPIKRSAELAPLSRDHHEGLLFVWKIRQGLKKGVEARLISSYVQWFWENHLQAHFRHEEELLAPSLPSEPMVERMIDEHQEIEAMVRINESIADAGLLEQLAGLVNDHIRFEERELFPLAEKTIPQERLQQIQAQLDAAPTGECPAWKEEFWM